MVHRDPWEQQDSEGPAAFLAFSAYRDLGPKRSYQLAAERAGITLNTLRTYAYNHTWKPRVDAWDREMDKQARERLLLERGITAARHFDIANKMLDLVEKRVDAMANQDNGFMLLQARDLKEWLAIIAPLQRLSMEMSTAINETREGEAQTATDAVRALLLNPDAAAKAAELGGMLHGGEVVLSEHTRPEPVQPRTTGTHLHLVESDQSGGETE